MNKHKNRDWTRILKSSHENKIYTQSLKKEEEIIYSLASKKAIGENATVLCCGDGREMEMILKANSKYPQLQTLHGVDMLEVSKTQINQKINDGLWEADGVEISVLVENAKHTSIKKYTQDTVFLLLTMANFDNEMIDAVLKHVFELLKPNGKFVFSVFNEHALYTRMQVYREGNAPIKWVLNDGYVKFKEDWPEAKFSRQFRSNDVHDICLGSGFERPQLDSSFITHLSVVQKQSYVDQLNAQRRNKSLFTCALFLMMINSMFENKYNQECNGAVRTLEIAPGGGTYDFCIED